MELRYLVIILAILIMFIFLIYKTNNEISHNKLSTIINLLNDIKYDQILPNKVSQFVKEQFSESIVDNSLIDFITSASETKTIIKYPNEISLDQLHKTFFKIEHNLALTGFSIPEIMAAEDIYYYIPTFGWTIDNGWLIKSKDNYYIPEGLIKIPKGFSYEWTTLKTDNEDGLVFFKLLRHN